MNMNLTPEQAAVLAGFVGTVLGALVSLAGIWVQQRFQARQDRARLALDAAVRAYESAESHARWSAEHGGRAVSFDLGYYIALHSALMAQLSKCEDISEEQWINAHRKAFELSEAAVHFHEQRAAAKAKSVMRQT